MKRVNLLGMSLRSVTLMLLLALMAGGCELSATTLVVGSCQPKGYSTIQAAINAAPAGATVKVCPGYYHEQVTITQAVTLQGITSNDGYPAEIDSPSGGLTQTATDVTGLSVAYQVWVNNSPGPVNISNITFYGSGNGVSGCPPLIAGIFYQNSPGTIREVSTLQQYGNGCGVGIWVEGGPSNPSVTVENNVVNQFDNTGIYAETTYHADTELTAKITSNNVEQYQFACLAGIWLDSGTTSTVEKNVVSVGFEGYTQVCQHGILIGPSAAGSVSSNVVELYGDGIETYADGVSVSSNTLLGNATGINLQTSAAAIKQNSIMQNGAGIEFNCLANPNVLSNIINYATVGLDHVPSTLGTSTNKVFNASYGRTDGC